jgi:hypothetical protein
LREKSGRGEAVRLVKGRFLSRNRNPGNLVSLLGRTPH